MENLKLILKANDLWSKVELTDFRKKLSFVCNSLFSTNMNWAMILFIGCLIWIPPLVESVNYGSRKTVALDFKLCFYHQRIGDNTVAITSIDNFLLLFFIIFQFSGNFVITRFFTKLDNNIDLCWEWNGKSYQSNRFKWIRSYSNREISNYHESELESKKML